VVLLDAKKFGVHNYTYEKSQRDRRWKKKRSVVGWVHVERVWHDSADVAKKVNVALLEWGRRYLGEVWITSGARGWVFVAVESL